MPSITRRSAAAVLRPFGLTVAALLAVPAVASANTITVTSTADAGAGTLRAAVASAAGGDTIALPAGTITLTSGPISLPRLVTITGPGARLSTISGGNTSRVFTVGIGSNVTISGTTISDGWATTGAAILAQGELHLADVAVSANQVSGSGGAIFANAGPITIDRSTFRGNSASGNGGAMDFQGTGIVEITNSTFAGNSAGGHGGVYATQETSPEASVGLTNDTFVSNHSGGGAGSGPVMSTGAGTVSGYGNSVFVGNGDVCEQASQGENLTNGNNVFDGTPSASCNLRSHDLIVADVRMSGIGDHGGGTDTAVPLAGSAAIGAAGLPCPLVDQRGVTRPDDASDAGSTQPVGPVALTRMPIDFTDTTATLAGSVNGFGAGPVTWTFEWGTTFAYGNATTAAVASGTGAVDVTAPISGLPAGTTIHYRLIASSPDGSTKTPDATFTTAQAATNPGGSPAPTPTATPVPSTAPSPSPAATPKPTTPKPTASTTTCTVPKTKGLTPSKARGALRSAHCTVGKTITVRSAAVRPGRVIGTAPAAGTKVAATTPITVRVAKR